MDYLGVRRSLLGLCAACVLLLAACGEGEESATDADVTTTVAEAPVAEEDSAAEDDAAEDSVAETVGSGDGTLDLGFADLLAPSAVSQLSADEQECVEGEVEAEGISLADDFDSLTLDQQAAGLEAVFDCAPEAVRAESNRGFAESQDVLDNATLQEASDCAFEELIRDDDGQRNRIRAMAYAGEDLPAPPETLDDGAAFMATCFNFGELMATGLAAQDLGDAVDASCLESVFDEQTSEQLFRELLANPTAFDDDEPPESFLVIFECFQFGQLFAEQLAELADLSDAEISCLDEAFRSPAMIAAFTSADANADVATEAMFSCFSPETMSALAGG